jgi:hypothetical protein
MCRYTFTDYHPDLWHSEEHWAHDRAAEAWQMWDAGHGAGVDTNGAR